MNIFSKIIILLTVCFTNLYAEISFSVIKDDVLEANVEQIFDTTGSSITVEKNIKNLESKFLGIFCSSDVCSIGFSAVYNDLNKQGTTEAYVFLDDQKWNNHIDFEIRTYIDYDDTETYSFAYTKEFFNEIVQSESFRAQVGNLIFNIDLTKLPMSNFSF